MAKYKEYFLNPKGTWLRVTDLIRNDKPETHVHVIEKAALVDALALLNECRYILAREGDSPDAFEMIEKLKQFRQEVDK